MEASPWAQVVAARTRRRFDCFLGSCFRGPCETDLAACRLQIDPECADIFLRDQSSKAMFIMDCWTYFQDNVAFGPSG